MKTLKFLKINFMLVIALVTAGVTMSFQKNSDDAASTTYFYNDLDISPNAFADVSHWGTANEGPCLTEGDRPCRIVVPDGQTLSSMLSGKNNDQVLALVTQRKP